MADARTEAVEAMATRLLDKWVADHECDRSDDALAQATDDAETALDAIPTAVLVSLVIERGGLEQADWDPAPDDEWAHDRPAAKDPGYAATLARLAIEAGGLEQVGWGGCRANAESVCTGDDGHESYLRHVGDPYDLRPDHPRWPVYRIAEEPT